MQLPLQLCKCREQDVVTSVGPSLHALSVKDVIKVQDRGEKRVPGQGGGGWGCHGSCTKFAGTLVLTTVYECPKPSVSYF